MNTLVAIYMLILFEVFIAAILLHIGVPGADLLVSALPPAIVVLALAANYRVKADRISIYSVILVSGLGIAYVLFSTWRYGPLDGGATFKTFFIYLPYTLLFLLMQNKSQCLTMFHRFYIVSLWIVSEYSIVEYIDRTYFHALFIHLDDFVRVTGVGGLNYLGHGGGFGIMPLGIFYDLHTASAFIVIGLFVTYSEKRWTLFLVLLIALILSYRRTAMIAFFLGFIMQTLPIYTLIIFVPVFVSLVYMAAENIQGQSWSILMHHLITKYQHFFNFDIPGLIFGHGYERTGFAEIFGYNELFIILYLYYFGLVGVLYILGIMGFVYYRFKGAYGHNGIYYDKLALPLCAVIPIFLLHYNLFFAPSVIFSYAYLCQLSLKDKRPLFRLDRYKNNSPMKGVICIRK